MTFLTDAEVEAMTGCKRGEHQARSLRNWLVDNGYVEKVDFFKRKDGWYSVMHPHMRTAVETPRPKVRKRA